MTFVHSMMCQYGMSESRSATFPIEKARHLLDDSFLESQSPVRNDPHSTSVSNGLSLGLYLLYCLTKLSQQPLMFYSWQKQFSCFSINQFLLMLFFLINLRLKNKPVYYCCFSQQAAVKALLGRSCHLEWKGKSQS